MYRPARRASTVCLQAVHICICHPSGGARLNWGPVPAEEGEEGTGSDAAPSLPPPAAQACAHQAQAQAQAAQSVSGGLAADNPSSRHMCPAYLLHSLAPCRSQLRQNSQARCTMMVAPLHYVNQSGSALCLQVLASGPHQRGDSLGVPGAPGRTVSIVCLVAQHPPMPCWLQLRLPSSRRPALRMAAREAGRQAHQGMLRLGLWTVRRLCGRLQAVRGRSPARVALR